MRKLISVLETKNKESEEDIKTLASKTTEPQTSLIKKASSFFSKEKKRVKHRSTFEKIKKLTNANQEKARRS